MDSKKILSKIENANMEGAKKTGNMVKEFFVSAFFLVIFLLFCEWAHCFSNQTTEIVVLAFVAVYLLALLIYKHFVRAKFKKINPTSNISSKLFIRLFYLYLFVSTILSTLVEFIIKHKTPMWKLLLFAICISAMNYFVEGIYHYWGTLFYNCKAFILSLIIISIINCILLHIVLSGLILILGVIIVFLLLSLFAPKGVGFGIDSFGRATYFYYF